MWLTFRGDFLHGAKGRLWLYFGVLQERKGMLLFPLFPYSDQQEQPLYFRFYLCFGILESLPLES